MFYDTGPANLPTNSATQTLRPLPALVTAVAQSTVSSMERALDHHFTSLLHQQQQLMSAVQHLAHPQAEVSLPSLSSSSLTRPPSSMLAGGAPESVTPQPQIPPAAILRSIPLITSTLTTVHPLSLLAISTAENSRTLVPWRSMATPIPAIAELPGTTVAEWIWKGE